MAWPQRFDQPHRRHNHIECGIFEFEGDVVEMDQSAVFGPFEAIGFHHLVKRFHRDQSHVVIHVVKRLPRTYSVFGIRDGVWGTSAIRSLYLVAPRPINPKALTAATLTEASSSPHRLAICFAYAPISGLNPSWGSMSGPR